MKHPNTGTGAYKPDNSVGTYFAQILPDNLKRHVYSLPLPELRPFPTTPPISAITAYAGAYIHALSLKYRNIAGINKIPVTIAKTIAEPAFHAWTAVMINVISGRPANIITIAIPVFLITAGRIQKLTAVKNT